jgi:hypothetical protein
MVGEVRTRVLQVLKWIELGCEWEMRNCRQQCKDVFMNTKGLLIVKTEMSDVVSLGYDKL